MRHTNAQLVPTKPQSQRNNRVGNLATIGGNQTSSSANLNLNRYMHHRWQASQYPLLRRSVHHCRIPQQLRCTLHQLRCPTTDCHNSTTTTPPPTHITVRSATPHRTTTIATSKQPPSNTTAATSIPRTTTANLTSAQTTLAEPHSTPKRESPAHIIYIALLRLLVTTIGYLHRLRQRLPNYPARSTSTSTHRSHAYHALSTAPSHCNHPLRPASKARTYNYDGSKYNYDDSGPIYDALHNLRQPLYKTKEQSRPTCLNEMSQYRAYFSPGSVDPFGLDAPSYWELYWEYLTWQNEAPSVDWIDTALEGGKRTGVVVGGTAAVTAGAVVVTGVGAGVTITGAGVTGSGTVGGGATLLTAEVAPRAAAQLARLAVTNPQLAVQVVATNPITIPVDTGVAEVAFGIDGPGNDLVDVSATGIRAISKGADFYVTPSGSVIPSTGFRAIGGPAVVRAEAGDIMSSTTYFTFDDISNLTAAEIKNLLQLKYPPSHVADFDTLQIIDDITVPYGRWNEADYLEPITLDFPDLGDSGGTQVITNTVIETFNLNKCKSP